MKKHVAWCQSKIQFLAPFLIAIYSVLFLYANNIKQYHLSVLFSPLAFALVFTFVVFFISKILLKKPHTTALITSYIVFVCLSFERIVNLISTDLKIGSFKISEEILVATVAIILLFLLNTILKKHFPRILSQLPIFLFYIFGMLVIFSLVTIFQYEISYGRIGRQNTPNISSSNLQPHETKNFPDIYYVIFDRYAGQRSLKEQYGYDNSDFLDFLKENGFYVAENSTANYPKTFLSLASSLNMRYLNDLSAKTNGGASSDESLMTPLVRNNELLAFLKKKGYKYINVGSWWEPTSFNSNADVNFKGGSVGYPFADEFTTGYLNTTIAAPILKLAFRDPNDISFVPQDNIHRKAIIYEFNALQKIPPMPGPKFVFAHILLPHDPFVFDKDCKPISEKVVKGKQHQENYLNQLQCANKKIKVLLNTILSKSKTKPVIIFQADEGPFPMNSPLPPKQSWGTATTQALNEKFPILNAYYFPGISNTRLYNTITPVNSFRILLNHYFHTDYSLLPDKNYVFQDEDHYYKFIDVTDKIR